MIQNKSDIVIVIGTYNRGHLLERSLKAYEKNKDIKIIVLDDGSDDNTRQICDLSKCNIIYQYLGDKTGWRDSASYLNAGIRYAIQEMDAKYVFITHPEIIVGDNTIRDCVALSTNDNTWVSAKGYYLTADQQKYLDVVEWQKDLLNVRKLPNFYTSESAEFNGDPNYLPINIEKIDTWQSWIFGGGSVDMWRYFGGLTEFEVWGSVDVDLYNRRIAAEIKTVTPSSESSIVVHQNHDDLGTPRDMDKCLAALPVYNSKSEALKPELF